MDVAVVIPTRDRLRKLERTLGALGDQKLEGHTMEVVVVDNGSTDGTAAWVTRRAASFAFPLTVVEEARPSVSVARNRGVAAAGAELILSINDDTRPADRELVRRHADLHADATGPLAVLGSIEYAPELPSSPFLDWLGDGPHFASRRLLPGPVHAPQYFYSTHLSFVRRQWEEIGGMDERLRYGFEDAEVGVRFFDDGVRLEYHPELVVHHDHPVTLSGWYRRTYAMGRAGHLANVINPRFPEVARPAVGARWGLAAMGARAVRHLPTDWAWLPRRPRETVYRLVNAGAYGAGYRLEERRSGLRGRPVDD